ncbi:MAG: O-methyltransferase [Actinomycetota bacterium]
MSKDEKDEWTRVDEYFNGLLMQEDLALAQALADSRAAGLPAINVAPNQGKLLFVLAKAMGARKILEIGTLGGYSTIWLARALPQDGRLITLEFNGRHAEIAAANIARAGLEKAAQIRQGRALDTLQQLVSEGAGPFDLIFIDADKPGYADYFAWSLKLAHPGSLIIADNVVRNGAVADAESQDEKVLGVRRFNEAVGREARVSATVLQTVGSKGYDGMVLAVVKE